MKINKEWVKAVFILPINVTIIIPLLILFFTDFQYKLPSVIQIVIGVCLLVLGLYLAIWTMILFNNIGKGTLAPWAPPKYLVVEGPFKIVRNPMITGILTILLSEALILNSISIFYWLVLFFLINCVYFKLFEEKQLEINFGDEYLEYKKNVPMWFPKLKLK